MTTTALINFATGGNRDVVGVRKHADGSPDRIFSDFRHFFAEVEAQVGTPSLYSADPYLLAARYVVWAARSDTDDLSNPLDFDQITLHAARADCGESYQYRVTCGMGARPVVTVLH